MTIAKNPLVKLRTVQGMTCYNGYVNELHLWETQEKFVAFCLKHDEFQGATPTRKARIRRLAREAWDWWHNESNPKRKTT